jgi:hypothetical protein
MEEIAAAIPDDLASLRPEDIRVEAEFADLVVTTSPPVPPPPEVDPATAQALPVDLSPVAEAAASSTVAAADLLPAASSPVLEQSLGTILPQISIETPSILPRSQETRAVHEVVLQPATVLAWSLLVLLSLPMAFVAGLLIGHFVWK